MCGLWRDTREILNANLQPNYILQKNSIANACNTIEYNYARDTAILIQLLYVQRFEFLCK